MLIGKRIFITGGTGFIGKSLVKRLSGNTIGLYVHKTQPEMPIENVFIGDLGDFRQLDQLTEFLKDFQPEIIFHLAAQPLVGTALQDDVGTIRTNSDGTYLLCAAARQIENLRAFVHISTDKVYGNQENPSESSPLKGLHPYDTSKAAGDMFAQTYAKVFGLPITICRSGNIYGEGESHFERIVPSIIRSVLRNKPIILRSNGTPVRDYIYVDDIVDAYLLLAEQVMSGNLLGRAVNFGSVQPMSVNDMVHEVLGVAQRVDLPVKIERNDKFEIPHQHLNWDLAKSLGWTPKTSIEDGLGKTLNWYKSNQGVLF